MLFRSRRQALVAGLGALVILAAVGFGAVYLLFFGGSPAHPLALSGTSSPTASPAQSGQGSGTWTIAEGTTVGYRVREQLASLPAPSDAVGRTSAINGTMTLTQSGGTYSVTAATFSVEVSTLTSDRPMRDQRIKVMGLESNRYPTATFKLTTPIALPGDATSGQAIQISATGDLTIHGTTRSVTIPIDAQLTGSQIQLVGSLTFPFSQFNMMPPNIAGFVTVQDNATMEFKLLLQHA